VQQTLRMQGLQSEGNAFEVLPNPRAISRLARLP
jgi:hypothetical protein